MCFEVPTLNPSGSLSNGKTAQIEDEADDDDDLGILDIDDDDSKTSMFWLLKWLLLLKWNKSWKFHKMKCLFNVFTKSKAFLTTDTNCIFTFAGKNTVELAALNECLRELLDGIQVMFTLDGNQ